MSRVQLPVVAQDAAGNAVSGASITIVNRQTGQAPVVYTTETGGTARSLPLTTGVNGRPPESWVDRAGYLITVTAAAVGTDVLAWDAATAGDQTVTTAWLSDGSVGWAKTGVGDAGLARGAFYVHSTAATVITPNTNTIIPLVGVTFDVSGGANGTGYTVPVSGVYRVTGQWRCATGASGLRVILNVRNAADQPILSTVNFAGGAEQSFLAIGLIKLVAGDTLRLSVTLAGTTTNLNTMAGPFNTFLCGELVGRT